MPPEQRIMLTKNDILRNLDSGDLRAILGMWPVYQADDLGQRVVAIYQDPSSAEILQNLINNQGYRVEPMITHAPSPNRLRKIFGGSYE